NKSSAGFAIAAGLGHTVEPLVPSLFTFHIDDARLIGLSGVAVEEAVATVPGTKLRESGPLLITHWGLSGPAILKLSAWGARELHHLNYRFPLHVNWLPNLKVEAIAQALELRRKEQPARFVVNSPFMLPARLWEKLVLAAGLARE